MPRTIESVVADLRRDANVPDDVDIDIDPMTDNLVVSRGEKSFIVTRKAIDDNLHVPVMIAMLPTLTMDV